MQLGLDGTLSTVAASTAMFTENTPAENTPVLYDVGLQLIAALHKWRDGVAREEDESTGYVLPRKLLARVATGLPASLSALRELVGPGAKVVLRRAAEVLAVIAAAQQVAAWLDTHCHPWSWLPAANSSCYGCIVSVSLTLGMGIPRIWHLSIWLQTTHMCPKTQPSGQRSTALCSCLQAPDVRSSQPAAPTPQQPSAVRPGAGANEAAACPATQGPAKRSQLQARRIGPIATAGGPAMLQDSPAGSRPVSVSMRPPTGAIVPTPAGTLPDSQVDEQMPAAPTAAAGPVHMAATAAGGRLRPRAVRSIAHSSGSGLLGGAAAAARAWQPAAAAPATQPALHEVAASAAQGVLTMEAPSPAAAGGTPSDPGARPAADSSAQVRHLLFSVAHASQPAAIGLHPIEVCGVTSSKTLQPAAGASMWSAGCRAAGGGAGAEVLLPASLCPHGRGCCCAAIRWAGASTSKRKNV